MLIEHDFMMFWTFVFSIISTVILMIGFTWALKSTIERIRKNILCGEEPIEEVEKPKKPNSKKLEQKKEWYED